MLSFNPALLLLNTVYKINIDYKTSCVCIHTHTQHVTGLTLSTIDPPNRRNFKAIQTILSLDQ